MSTAGEDARSETPTVVDEPTLTVRRPSASRLMAEIPDRIGRFAVLRRVGTGGMGVVYSAYDEDLDRRVALKLLHNAPHGDSSGRARLQREAQALARLSHPNVVQVYEVGNLDDAVYLAMELVRGRSLREWLHQTKPSLAARIDAMRQAGAGLVAAHAAGLIHRDFKLENVLMGDDGRVRVVDFGVARIHGLSPAPPADPGGASRSGDGLSTLTVEGTIVGTPSYMAPELWAGEPADEKSDQFAFCVALYELLFDARPYVGKDRAELERAIAAGEPRPPPAGSPVPPHLRRLALRGLQADRAARWPDMRALLTELGRDPGRGRRIALSIALGAAGMIGVGYAVGAREVVEPCAHAGETYAIKWDDGRRDAVAAALAAIDRPWAADAASRVTGSLDAYAARMQAIAHEGCAATWVRHEQTEALLDRQTLCLGAAARDFGALATVLAEADPGILERASGAIAELPPLDRCEDREALLGRLDLPADTAVAEAVEALRDRLAAAKATHRSSPGTDTTPELEALLAEAEALGYAPLRAELLQALGTRLQHTGAHQDARARLEDAWVAALGAGHDDIALDAATSLTYLVGDILQGFDEAHRWGRDAEAMRERSGATGRRAAWVENNIGSVLYRQGDLPGAQLRYAAAVAIAEDLDPPEPEALASFVNNLGNCDTAAGAYTSARAHYERAIGLREQALGPAHPGLLSPLNNLASVIRVGGDPVAAMAVMRRAVAIADGPGIDQVRRAHTHMNLSSALSEQNEHTEALAEGELALGLYRAHGDPQHPNVGVALSNIAGDLASLGRVQEGCDMIAQGLLILDPKLGAGHPSVAPIHGGRGNCLAQLGRIDEALVEFELALAEWNETTTTDPQVGHVLRNYAETLLAADRVDEAIAVLERARTNHAGDEVPAHERAGTAFALARALRAARREPVRVTALIGEARAGFASATGEHADKLARLEAFATAGPP